MSPPLGKKLIGGEESTEHVEKLQAHLKEVKRRVKEEKRKRKARENDDSNAAGVPATAAARHPVSSSFLSFASSSSLLDGKEEE